MKILAVAVDKLPEKYEDCVLATSNHEGVGTCKIDGDTCELLCNLNYCPKLFVPLYRPKGYKESEE